MATAFTILVGSVSFAGSMVTFAKLQELITTRPVIFPGLPIAFGASAIAGVALAAYLAASPAEWVGIVLALVGLLLGLLLVLPVGGADVPIVISLLNAFTGLSVAAGGYVSGNTVLLVGGTLVGASGNVPHQDDGQRHGPVAAEHPLRGTQGWFDARGRVRSPTVRSAPQVPRT